jgi:hypothetical protein
VFCEGSECESIIGNDSITINITLGTCPSNFNAVADYLTNIINYENKEYAH